MSVKSTPVSDISLYNDADAFLRTLPPDKLGNQNEARQTYLRTATRKFRIELMQPDSEAISRRIVDAFDRAFTTVIKRKALLNQAYVFLSSKEVRGDLKQEIGAFRAQNKTVSLSEAQEVIKQAFDAVYFDEASQTLQTAAPFIHLPLNHKCKKFFELYPQYAQRYLLKVYMEHRTANPHGDAEALSHEWRNLMQRLDREIPFLSDAIDRLRETPGVDHNTFRAAYHLHCAKHDPRIKKIAPEELWGFLKAHYPFLTNPKSLNEEQFLKQTAENPEWDQVILESFPEEDSRPIDSMMKTFQSAEALVKNLTADVSENPFFNYLQNELGLDTNEIEPILKSMEQNQSGLSWNPAIKRQQVIRSCFSEFINQLYQYEKLLGGSDLRLLDKVSRDFTTLGPEACEMALNLGSFPLSPEAKTYLTFGSLIPMLQSAKALGNLGTPLLFAILKKQHPAAARLTDEQLDIWKCRSSMAFEAVVADMVQNKNPNHPLSIHHQLSQLTKNQEDLVVPKGIRRVTRQFFKDCDRYDVLILANGDAATLSFPGDYGIDGKARAKGALVAGLEDLAQGKDPQLLFLLQEMAAGQNSYGRFVDLWIRSDLGEKTGGDPRINGFIMLIPRNTTRAIKKEAENLFTAEYDFELRTNNQHMMDRMDLAPPDYQVSKTHHFRIKYEIRQSPSGEWRVQQPTWEPMTSDPAKKLQGIHKPFPVPLQEEPLLEPKAPVAEPVVVSADDLDDNDIYIPPGSMTAKLEQQSART